MNVPPTQKVPLGLPGVLLSVVLTVVSSTGSQASPIAIYNFGSSGSTLVRTSSDADGNSTASLFNDGRSSFGVGSKTGNPAPSYAVTTNKLQSSLAAAVSANDFGQFTVNATGSGALNFSRLTFDVQDSASGVAGNWVVRSSVDNFQSNLATVSANTTFTTHSINLSGAEFQGLSSITFRFYLYNTGTKSTTVSMRLDNVKLDNGEGSSAGGGNSTTTFEITEVAAQTEEFFRHSEGGALRLPNGDILLAWSRFYAEEGNPARDDNAPANIVLSRSTNNGVTWSAPLDLGLPRGNINNMQVSMLQVGNSVHLYYSVRNSGSVADKWLIESTDNGITWSSPRRVTPGGRRHTGPNDRMVHLSSGRILLPCHTSLTINGRQELAPIIGYSDDGGATWTMGSPILAEPQYYQLSSELKMHEPALVERRDGSVWMIARTTTGRFFQSVSTDGGATWSLATPSNIESMTAPPQLKRLADGRLLLVWNPLTPAALNHLSMQPNWQPGGLGVVPGYFKRSILAAATSNDDGATWSAPIVLADGGDAYGYCYPAVLEVGNEILIHASKTPNVIYPCSLVQIRVPLSALGPIQGTTTRGTPISWLRNLFGESADYNALELLDHDGDGQAAWEEFKGGTDPLNPQSHFRPSLTISASGQWILEWQGGIGTGLRTPYLIQVSSDMAPGSWTTVAEVPRVPGPVQRWVVPPHLSTFPRFFRIVIA